MGEQLVCALPFFFTNFGQLGIVNTNDPKEKCNSCVLAAESEQSKRATCVNALDVKVTVHLS